MNQSNVFIQTQKSYCVKRKVPLFMPSDGCCFSCGRQIVPELIARNIRADSTHITGCPLCNSSFCE